MIVTEQRVDGWDEFLTMLDGSTATYTVGWIDATATAPRLGAASLKKAKPARVSCPNG
jgi:decaprenylphospho-beta-D-ribofuranose 2-oxidase